MQDVDTVEGPSSDEFLSQSHLRDLNRPFLYLQRKKVYSSAVQEVQEVPERSGKGR